MSTGGDVSEQLVRDGMIVAEELTKIAGHLSKETIALLAALIKREKQAKGATPVSNLKNQALKTGQALEIFQIKAKDVAQFKSLAKEFGVLYHKKPAPPVFLSKDTGNIVDVLALSGDAPGINHILEKMGYTVPERDDGKNGETRAASEQNFSERGNGYEKSRPNVKGDDGKAASNGPAGKEKSVAADIRRFKQQADKINSSRGAGIPKSKPGPVR